MAAEALRDTTMLAALDPGVQATNTYEPDPRRITLYGAAVTCCLLVIGIGLVLAVRTSEPYYGDAYLVKETGLAVAVAGLIALMFVMLPNMHGERAGRRRPRLRMWETTAVVEIRRPRAHVWQVVLDPTAVHGIESVVEGFAMDEGPVAVGRRHGKVSRLPNGLLHCDIDEITDLVDQRHIEATGLTGFPRTTSFDLRDTAAGTEVTITLRLWAPRGGGTASPAQRRLDEALTANADALRRALEDSGGRSTAPPHDDPAPETA